MDLAWLAGQPVLVGAARWGPVVLALGAHGALVAAEHRRPQLRRRDVVVAVALVATAAAVLPPYGSRDLYQYAAYGRLALVHDLDPYRTGPGAAAGDPIVAHVAPAWRQAPSVYGPAFTGLSMLGAVGFGTSPVRARLWFQGLAAISLVASVELLRRRGAPTWVLIGLGLGPSLLAVVNGGHNDLLVGALGLAGADLVGRARPVRGAVLLGAACLVKLLAVPIVAGLVVGLVAGRHRRAAAQVAGVVAGLLVAGYALVGGIAALAPLASLGDHRSRATVWSLASRTLPGLTPETTGLLATASVALVSTVLVVRCLAAHRRSAGPASGVELALGLGLATCALATYVLPWYPAAFLPLAGLVPRGRAAVALHLLTASLLLAYVQPPGRPASALVGAGAAAGVTGAVAVVLVASVLVIRRPSIRAAVP